MRRLLPLLFLLLIGSVRPATSVAEHTDRGASVTLARLRESPDLFVGQRVRCVLQLASVDGPWEPWTSRFGPRDFRRLEAWCDSQLPWYEEAFVDPARFLFVRRGGLAEFVLDGAHAHERFEAELVVRELLLGEPWAEVVSLERIRPAIGEGAVLHASKALELADKQLFELAVSEAERALGSPLPDHAADDLEQLLATWRAELEL